MYPVIDKKRTGKRIREIMRLCQKSPADIQKFLGLACVQTVYRWLEGVNVPTLDNLYALSQFFGLPLDDMLVGGSDRNEFSDREYRIYVQYMRRGIYCRGFQGAGEG